MEDREKAKREYLNGKSLKSIAGELGIKYDTVRQWKKRYSWPNVVTKNRHTKKQCDNVTVNKELMQPLNDKQQLFCEIYVTNFNATQAYIKSYNSDYNTAMSNGYKLLRNTSIRSYISQLKEIKRKSILADENDIVEMYMKIAFSDVKDYLDFGQEEVPISPDSESTITVNYVDLKSSNKVDGSVISEIKKGKQGVSLKLHDKLKALEWLSKYFNMNPMDKHKISYDRVKQELDRLEYERRKKADESGNW